MDQLIDAGALLRVVVVSLLLGTTIPAVFALGVRVLALDGPPGATPRPAPSPDRVLRPRRRRVVLGVLTILRAK